MQKLIGLEGGSNGTWFKVLDVKEAMIKNYPSIKSGKIQSPLDVAMDAEFFKYKKEVVVPGYFATIAGNAVCAAEGIMDFLEGVPHEVRYNGEFVSKYAAVAVNPNCVDIWLVSDYDEQVRRACNG
jgi:hypothetical protein